MFPKHLPILKTWLPLAFALTVVCLLVYAAVQQDYRQNANDPQIQMVEDVADALQSGLAVQNLNSQVKLDLAKTLSSFMIVYDETGKALVSSGYLNGQVPVPPAGVLTAAKAMGQNRLTWQPQANVRLATVVQYYKADKQSGYVLAGRSLAEVEKRENQTFMMVLAAWLISLVGSLILVVLFNWPFSKKIAENVGPDNI